MSEKSKTTDKNKNSNSVDQIRNILFGEQIDLIEQRFIELENNLTKTIEQLSLKVNNDNSELKDQLDTVNQQLQKDNTNQAQQNSKDLKSLEASINNKIIETEAELLNQIQSGLAALDDKASHRKELADMLHNMADKLSD